MSYVIGDFATAEEFYHQVPGPSDFPPSSSLFLGAVRMASTSALAGVVGGEATLLLGFGFF